MFVYDNNFNFITTSVFSGVCLVIFAGCTFTAANVVQKIVAPELNFWSLLLIR